MKTTFAIILTTLLFLVAACEGPQGDMGPAGPQGEQGEAGQPGPGSRIVYNSTTTVPTMDEWYMLIPEIKLKNLPLVAVYGALATAPNDWTELPLYSDAYDYTMFYWLEEGSVHFANCQGLWIKVVIVV